MRKSIFAVALAISAGLATGAQASTFNGGTVEFQYYSYGGAYNGSGSPAAIVTPGSATFADYFTVTVSGNHITYDYLSDTTWSPSTTSLNSGGLYIDNGSLISSVSGIPAFTSVTLDPSSNLGSSGFTASDVTWNSGNVAVTWMDQTFAAGDTVILDVNAAATPLPPTWTMLIAGFVGLGFLAYRGTKKNNAALAA